MTPSAQLLDFAMVLCLAVLLPIVPACVLYNALPTSTRVSGPFRGLNIQLTGAFGAKPYSLRSDARAMRRIIDTPIELEPLPNRGQP